jgi:hypothetical protein
LKLITS